MMAAVGPNRLIIHVFVPEAVTRWLMLASVAFVSSISILLCQLEGLSVKRYCLATRLFRIVKGAGKAVGNLEIGK